MTRRPNRQCGVDGVELSWSPVGCVELTVFNYPGAQSAVFCWRCWTLPAPRQQCCVDDIELSRRPFGCVKLTVLNCPGAPSAVLFWQCCVVPAPVGSFELTVLNCPGAKAEVLRWRCWIVLTPSQHCWADGVELSWRSVGSVVLTVFNCPDGQSAVLSWRCSVGSVVLTVFRCSGAQSSGLSWQFWVVPAPSRQSFIDGVELSRRPVGCVELRGLSSPGVQSAVFLLTVLSGLSAQSAVLCWWCWVVPVGAQSVVLSWLCWVVPVPSRQFCVDGVELSSRPVGCVEQMVLNCPGAQSAVFCWRCWFVPESSRQYCIYGVDWSRRPLGNFWVGTCWVVPALSPSDFILQFKVVRSIY